MKAKQSLKILYRSPVKTVLTFILLAAVTFALFSQALEYIVAKREMEKAVSLYDGVGSIKPGEFNDWMSREPGYMYADKRVPQGVLPEAALMRYRDLGYEALTKEQIDEITNLPYISYADIHYTTAGVTKYRRIDQNARYYDYTNICVLEADVTRVYQGGYFGSYCGLDNIELIAGEPIATNDLSKGNVIVSCEPKDAAYEWAEQLELDVVEYWHYENDRGVCIGTENSEYDNEFMNKLEAGKRYVFILRYEDEVTGRANTYTYYLTDPFVYGQCEAVYLIENEPENYLETEKYAPLREYIEIIEADRYTQDIIYTKNMGSIRYFADGTMGIADGRSIVPEDTENENNVCVVNYDFALEYGLAVGDSIEVDLGDKLFEYNLLTGAVAAVKGRMSENYTKATLEIVGLFKDTRNKYAILEEEEFAWSYGKNAIFVPYHLLNVDGDELSSHEIHPQEFSFVVADAWNIADFKTGVIPRLEEMGYEVFFEDAGFGDILTAYKGAERTAGAKIAVLAAAMIVLVGFSVMLYITGRRRDYAVMRILGTSKRKAAGTLLLPLSVIAGAAILLGSAAAYLYVAENISSNVSLTILSGFETDMSVPVWVALLSTLCEAGLLLASALMVLGMLGRKSPLELMQGKGQKHRKRGYRNKLMCLPEDREPVILGQWEPIEKLKPGKKVGSTEFVRKYVQRHIRRVPGKSLMCVLATVILLNLLGQMQIMKNTYVEVFESTEVTSQFAGFMNLKNADELQRSGYVKKVFYKIDKVVDVNREKYFLFVCNDPYIFAEQMEYANVRIEFIEGYDINSMHTLGNVVIIGKDYMAQRGIKPGDMVELSYNGWYEIVKNNIIDSFKRSAFNADKYTDEEILEIEKESFDSLYYEKAENFLVIGSISDDKGITDKHVYTPGSKSLSFDYGSLIIPESVSAVLADNYKAEEYREYGKSLAGKNLTGEIAFVMDTSKLDNVRNNIELMDTLIPVITSAVMVIGAFLCGLIIVQTSKDIAIMRVLGTSKRKTRTIIVLEQMILCITGIIISVIILAIRGALIQMLWVFGVYALVILLASIAASVAASRKNVLELLQTKE